MLINIRGTNGSGKSTAVRHFLDKHGGLKSMTPHYEEGRRKPLYYTNESAKFSLIGHYESQCGGGDTISGYSKIVDICLNLYEQEYDVILESMMLSADTKQHKIMKKTIDDIRIIYLSTPLNECIKRIRQRRLDSGNTKYFNPTSTIGKFRGTRNSRQILEQSGFDCYEATTEEAGELIHKFVLEKNVSNK